MAYRILKLEMGEISCIKKDFNNKVVMIEILVAQVTI